MKTLLTITLILFLAGCESADFAGCDQVVVTGPDACELEAGAFIKIRQAKLVGHCLEVEFSYSGCERENPVKLCDLGRIGELIPAQQNLRLWVSHAGFCQMYVTRNVSFDLTPLRVSHGAMVSIHLEGWDEEIGYF